MHRSLKRFAVWLLLVIAIFSALTACSLLFFKPYILLTVQADRRSDLLVFYDNGSRRGYCFDDAHLSQAYPLSAEKQTLKIHIPRGGLDRLRFDFGNAPCNVWVYDLTIVPSRYRTYCYSPEAVFQTFDVLNDISESSLESGAIKYAVSGADGYIAPSDRINRGAARLISTLDPLYAAALICGSILFSLCVVFRKRIRLLGGKAFAFCSLQYKRHYRGINRLVLTMALEIGSVLLCPQFWFLETVFSVIVGHSVCCLLEYLAEDRSLQKDYLRIILVGVIAFLPLCLTDFCYGDSYWSKVAGRTAFSKVYDSTAMKRPFVGVINALVGDIPALHSHILRAGVCIVMILCALLLYKFILEKMGRRTLAYCSSVFLCASVAAVDCIAYLDVYPIVFSLLFSVTAYLAWEKSTEAVKNKLWQEAVFYGAGFAGSLLAAFCLYQIGTPIFFVMLVVAVLDERKQDKGVIRQGFVTVVAYGVIALFYLFFSSWLLNLYGIHGAQSERAKFIHTLPEILEKAEWFFVQVIPQSSYRLWASILPGRSFTTNNLFYTISFKSGALQTNLTICVFAVIFFYFVRLLCRRLWQKFLGCLCAVPLSFYPFLLLPESTVLTYYMMPLIMLLELFFFLGLGELFRLITGLLRNKPRCSGKGAVWLITVLLAVTSTRYANNWVLYCRDSYQYMKQSILSTEYQDIEKIHVYGKISPYVGGNPYVTAAVERILEEIGADPSQYIISQSDTVYAINQLTGEDMQVLKNALAEQDYERFIGLYKYSAYYDSYYLKTDDFTEEEQAFMKRSLERGGLIPSADDGTTLIISLTGFNRTHSF